MFFLVILFVLLRAEEYCKCPKDSICSSPSYDYLITNDIFQEDSNLCEFYCAFGSCKRCLKKNSLVFCVLAELVWTLLDKDEFKNKFDKLEEKRENKCKLFELLLENDTYGERINDLICGYYRMYPWDFSYICQGIFRKLENLKNRYYNFYRLECKGTDYDTFYRVVGWV